MKKLVYMSYFILAIAGYDVWAINMKACSKLLNDGLYKKYKYGGIDQPLTKATKKHGSSKASSVTSTEGSTASLDPKYWSNVTTSETQWISSTGECSAIGLKQVKSNRVKYIAQNYDEILKEIAQGEGEHLDNLALFSFCDRKAYKSFKSLLQENFNKVQNKSSKNIGQSIDSIVEENKSLHGHCYSFGQV